MNSRVDNAIRALRRQYVDLDNKARESYDHMAFASEFEQLQLEAHAENLFFFERFFAAKAAIQNERNLQGIELLRDAIEWLITHVQPDALPRRPSPPADKRDEPCSLVQHCIELGKHCLQSGKTRFSTCEGCLCQATLQNGTDLHDLCQQHDHLTCLKDLSLAFSALGTALLNESQSSTYTLNTCRDLLYYAGNAVMLGLKFLQNVRDVDGDGWQSLSFEQLADAALNLFDKGVFEALETIRYCGRLGDAHNGLRRYYLDPVLTLLRILCNYRDSQPDTGTKTSERAAIDKCMWRIATLGIDMHRNNSRHWIIQHPWFILFLADSLRKADIPHNSPAVLLYGCFIDHALGSKELMSILDKGSVEKADQTRALDLCLGIIANRTRSLRRRAPRGDLGGHAAVLYGSVMLARLLRRLLQQKGDRYYEHHNRLLECLRFDFDSIVGTSLAAEARFRWGGSRRIPWEDKQDALPTTGESGSRGPDAGSSAALNAARKAIARTVHEPHTLTVVADKSPPPQDNRLVILRTWSSYTPFVPVISTAKSHAVRSRGGGYLLLWKGIGVAIDPGPGFLDNLYEEGYEITDINVVLVTHNHPDHTFEIPALLSMAATSAHVIQHFVLSVNAHECYANMITATNSVCQGTLRTEVMKLSPESSVLLCIMGIGQQESLIKVDALRAIHADLYVPSPAEGLPEGGSKSLGLLISFPNGCRLMFTGDTAWPSNEQQIAGCKGDAMSRCFYDLETPPNERPTIVIPHISKVDIKTITDSSYYAKHLALRGTYNVIERSGATLAIVSEWGEDLAKYRKAICQALERSMPFQEPDGAGKRDRVVVLPGDRGLTVSLEKEPKVLCSCEHRNRASLDLCEAEPKSILVDQYQDEETGEWRIRYICPQHQGTRIRGQTIT